MSDWGYDDNDDNTQAGENLDGPKALREAYKKQGEKLDKALEYIEKMEARDREKSLTSTFESLGVPGAASVYQGDPDPEKAKAWVQSMQSVFGGTVAHATDNSQSAQPTLAPETQSAFQAFNTAGTDAEVMTRYEAANTEIKGKSPEEILAFWTDGKI